MVASGGQGGGKQRELDEYGIEQEPGVSSNGYANNLVLRFDDDGEGRVLQECWWSRGRMNAMWEGEWGWYKLYMPLILAAPSSSSGVCIRCHASNLY